MYTHSKDVNNLAEVSKVAFSEQQSHQLELLSKDLATIGGPRAQGSQALARKYATRLLALLSPQQCLILKAYAEGQLSLLVFTGMVIIKEDACPDSLPPKAELDNDFQCVRLAARNQLLLCLVQHRAFAFDMDNGGEIIRLVGNFKGGGLVAREDEESFSVIELSSHAGLKLGPHTEAPYHCSVKSQGGHSPAPSSLILSARWNPLHELTHIIPLNSVIDKLSAKTALALASNSFHYTRSDSFVAGKGGQTSGVSILEFDQRGEFSVRYNDYRFSVMPTASSSVEKAFSIFKGHIAEARPIRIDLQPSSAIIINNCRALHGREVIRDNRRLLVRLFGYSECADPIVLNEDPLLVKG